MFEIYIDKAMQKQSLSQNGLAHKIGISTACMSKMASSKILPSEETVLKVAALAGISPEQALIDLNIWRAQKDPARLAAWKKISKMIKSSLAILLFFANFNAVTLSSQEPIITLMYLQALPCPPMLV